MLEIVLIPVLEDNYLFLLNAGGETAVVDPAVDHAVMRALNARGWTLTHILNTHHHHDHTGANESLKQQTGCKIIGPKDEQDNIPGIDIAVGGGDTVTIGGSQAVVIDVPGHTKGHIAYHFGGGDRALFCGDALFAMGCGRVFEGTAAQMWRSLQRLMKLPDKTQIYCAHEYTQSNGEFALSLEPDNIVLQKRMDNVITLRQRGMPTIPSTIGLEKATNPFLRIDSYEIRAKINMLSADPVSVFADIRKRKDNF